MIRGCEIPWGRHIELATVLIRTLLARANMEGDVQKGKNA